MQMSKKDSDIAQLNGQKAKYDLRLIAKSCCQNGRKLHIPNIYISYVVLNI